MLLCALPVDVVDVARAAVVDTVTVVAVLSDLPSVVTRVAIGGVAVVMTVDRVVAAVAGGILVVVVAALVVVATEVLLVADVVVVGVVIIVVATVFAVVDVAGVVTAHKIKTFELEILL